MSHQDPIVSEARLRPPEEYDDDYDPSQSYTDQEPEHEIVLFIKAGSDRESIGCDPFSQRFFMMLWLKGIVFNVTIVDKATAPREIKAIAPGSSPPFLTFNGELFTDPIKMEDLLEVELTPPKYPRLACRHAESTLAGNDVFNKFSAWMRDVQGKNKMVQDRFF